MPVPNLKNRKCLVTGAASGIGKAVAIAAAQEGAELVLTDINAAQLLAVVDESGRTRLQDVLPGESCARVLEYMNFDRQEILGGNLKLALRLLQQMQGNRSAAHGHIAQGTG